MLDIHNENADEQASEVIFAKESFLTSENNRHTKKEAEIPKMLNQRTGEIRPLPHKRWSYAVATSLRKVCCLSQINSP